MKEDRHGDFLPDRHTRFPQSNHHGAPVHRLEEPIPQLIGNLVKHTDDSLGPLPLDPSKFHIALIRSLSALSVPSLSLRLIVESWKRGRSCASFKSKRRSADKSCGRRPRWPHRCTFPTRSSRFAPGWHGTAFGPLGTVTAATIPNETDAAAHSAPADTAEPTRPESAVP
jgi:hypothetical protein